MSANFLHVLSTFALLACPLMCAVDSPLVQVDSPLSQAELRSAERCTCCHQAPVGDAPAQPDGTGGEPTPGCSQCFCGGAVIEAANAIDLRKALTAVPLQVVPLSSGRCDAACFTSDRPPTAHLCYVSAGDGNLGRARRCALGSLLC